MRLGTASVAAALTAAAALLTAAPAFAADMPAYYAPGASPAPPDAPLEFGTGWYLRGDASFGPEDRPKLSLQAVPTFPRDATAWGDGFGGGAGSKFNDFFRADVTADYLDPFRYRANVACGDACVTSNVPSHTDLQFAWVAMAGFSYALGPTCWPTSATATSTSAAPRSRYSRSRASRGPSSSGRSGSACAT